jgi:TetR/AcrR family transcriptional regulator, cholesterol catabolism regulator
MEIKEQILFAAGQLFLKYGAKSITMDDIAKDLSISKKTIYQFYNDKDELVYEFVKLFLDIQKNDMNRIYESSQNAVEELFMLSDYIKTKIATMNPVALYDLEKYHKRAFLLFLEHKQSCFQGSIIRSLKRGIEEGYFRDDLNPEIVAKMRIENVQMAYNPTIFNAEIYNFQEVQIQLFEHFVYGIFTIKGYRLYNQMKNKPVD